MKGNNDEPVEFEFQKRNYSFLGSRYNAAGLKEGNKKKVKNQEASQPKAVRKKSPRSYQISMEAFKQLEQGKKIVWEVFRAKRPYSLEERIRVWIRGGASASVMVTAAVKTERGYEITLKKIKEQPVPEDPEKL